MGANNLNEKYLLKRLESKRLTIVVVICGLDFEVLSFILLWQVMNSSTENASVANSVNNVSKLRLYFVL